MVNTWEYSDLQTTETRCNKPDQQVPMSGLGREQEKGIILINGKDDSTDNHYNY
jgi:hypothetical protein